MLYDEAHGHPYRIGNSDPLDLSDLAALYRSNGFQVASNVEIFTRETLSPVDALIISGFFLPLTESELAVVLDFVNAVGGLAIVLHIALPVRDLRHHLKVVFTSGPLRETNQLINGNSLDFKVANLADHPLTSGMACFSVYGAQALRGTDPHTRCWL